MGFLGAGFRICLQGSEGSRNNLDRCPRHRLSMLCDSEESPGMFAKQCVLGYLFQFLCPFVRHTEFGPSPMVGASMDVAGQIA